MPRLLARAALGLSLVLGACADRAGSGTETTGVVNGIVLAFPGCPVERENSPCPDRPIDGVKVQVLEGGRVVATVVSGQDGAFRLDLEAGAYELQAIVEPGGPGLSSAPTRVIVPAGGAVDATVLLDTGLRAGAGGPSG